MYCKICGDVVRGKNFCTSCGHPVKIPVKKQAKSSKWIFIPIAVATALLAAIGSLYFFVLHDSHSNLDARIMSVFRVDGDTVRMQSAGGASTDAREGVGLHTGYAVSTGVDSFCYIRLDAASIVKMDMRTDVSIAQLTDRLLRINIDRGQVMVDLQRQAPEHVLEAIIGNTVISVRGTLFVAGVYAGGEAIITVLDGSVYVNDVRLDAGYTMRVFDGLEMIYEIEEINLGTADDFLLAAVGIIGGNGTDELPLAGQVEAGTTTEVGEVIQFGPFEWQVLDVQDGRALILAVNSFANFSFDSFQNTSTWETSSLRQFLNGEFLDRFSQLEQGRIAATTVINQDNPWFGTSGGNDTTDKVFLLSIYEIVKYFGDSGQLNNHSENAQSIVDQYSAARIAMFHVREFIEFQWWLRSPGGNQYNAAYVSSDGDINLFGDSVRFTGAGVRPAMWLYLGPSYLDIAEIPIVNMPTDEAHGRLSAGDIIQFGDYDWLVLDVQENRVFIITERVIDNRRYHENDAVTWEASEIRQWLNSEFLDRFNLHDRSRILEVTVANHDNQWFGTNGGNITRDLIFLLSLGEVVQYFGDSGLLDNRPNQHIWTLDDQYNSARRALSIDGSSQTWMLRSPGYFSRYRAGVNIFGGLVPGGSAVHFASGLRPALWLSLEP